MTTIILRIVLLAVFIAHFAIPQRTVTVTLKGAPFSDPTLAGELQPSCKG